MSKSVFTPEGLALVKNNGSIQNQALTANEKALDEHKWFLSGKGKDGQPRKRSTYVQYLRGYVQALKDLVDGTELKAWEPKPISASTNVGAGMTSDQLSVLIAKAVAEAMKAK
jgi:hypothetical protein